MNLFVESLRRLFSQDKVSLTKLEAFLKEGKISMADFQYITKSRGMHTQN